MRIENGKILCFIKGLICQADQVGFDLAGFFFVDTIDGLVARVRDLF